MLPITNKGWNTDIQYIKLQHKAWVEEQNYPICSFYLSQHFSSNWFQDIQTVMR